MPEHNCRSVFITGTDTGTGKTLATLALMQALKSNDNKVAGMKPVASGCNASKQTLTNDDALAIQAMCTDKLAYCDINPYAFLPPIAPHFAAKQAGIKMEIDVVRQHFDKLSATHDYLVMEGVGGWRVPISDHASLVDLVHALSLPVIMVVGLRLGCINHALLTKESILNDDVSLIGWIANMLEPNYGEVNETVDYLSGKIPAPLLGRLTFQKRPHPENLASGLDLRELNNCLARK